MRVDHLKAFVYFPVQVVQMKVYFFSFLVPLSLKSYLQYKPTLIILNFLTFISGVCEQLVTLCPIFRFFKHEVLY